MKTVPSEKFYRLFYPQIPMAVVAESRGTIGAALVASAMAASRRPPMVAISLYSQSFTLELIRESGLFSINWLDYSMRSSMDILGFRRGRGQKNKLAMAGLNASRSSFAVTYISEAVAHLECKVKTVQATGDHSTLLANVLAAEGSEDFAEYWAFKTYKPLLYIGSENERGKYLTLRPRPTRQL